MSARWRHLKDKWAVLSYYERFASTVALVLTLVIALVVAVALFRLGESVVARLLLGVLDPLDHQVLTYWLLRERDDRLTASRTAPSRDR